MKRVIVILFVMIIVIGCGGSGPGDSTIDYDFRQGSGGVVINFQKNAPPEKLFPSSKFKIVLDLQNQNAYALDNPLITILGLKPTYFRLNQYEQSVDDLQGKSAVNPGGDRVFVEFDGISGNLFQNAVQEVNQYTLKLQFDSKVEFEDTICINPNLYAVYDAGCQVEAQQSYGGQGGPIGIRSMEQIMYPEGAGGRVEFRFVVSNLGRGQAKFVNLGQAFIGNQPLECIFEGQVTNPKTIEFGNNQQEGLITCQSILRDQQSFATTIRLDMTYDYEIQETHQLNLVNPQYSAGRI